MSGKSAIEWTDATWNPVTGCTKVSPGCDHCYAETLTERFHGKGSFAEVKLHPDRLEVPLHWRKPRKVFVNSMSDLFHQDIPDEYIAKVFAVMSMAPQHTFQVLTKRHARMRALLSSGIFRIMLNAERLQRGVSVLPDSRRPDGTYAWPLRNVWLGVSVEDQQWADIRIPALLQTPAAVRFLSCEPLLGPITLEPWLLDKADLASGVLVNPLHWVIVGGESGHGARPMERAWATRLRDECNAADVAFLFKQWGGRTPKTGGRELDGRTWDEYPIPVAAIGGAP